MTSTMTTKPEDQQQNDKQDKQEPLVREAKQQTEKAAKPTEKRFAPLLAFWQKINNDLIFNWSGALAYTLIVSLFPILLVILAIAGLILGAIAPDSVTHLENILAGGLPGGAGGTGGVIVKAVLHQLHHSAGIFLVIGIVGAIISGSGLFLSLESAFGIVFRLPGRDPVHQRIMAVGLMLLYVVLVPLMVLASVALPAILNILGIGTRNPVSAFFIQVIGLLVAFASACLFFGIIFLLVPNRRMRLRDVWKGTLLTAGLLVLYELAFPIYENLFLHPNSYGSLAGFAIVILTFFYYLAFILLLGAEVNSMVVGLRPTKDPINALLYNLELRGLLNEPANVEPTEQAAAKSPQANQQLRQASKELAAVRLDMPAISHTATPQFSILPAPTSQKLQKPLTRRQRITVGAVAIAGTIAIAPVLRFTKRLVTG